MRRSTSDTTEFLIIIVLLAAIFFILQLLNITINRLYVVIPFLFIWIAIKMIRNKKAK